MADRFAHLIGVLLLFRDLILAGEMFGNLFFQLIGDVVWLTYGPAQMLIVYSIGTAWQIESQKSKKSSTDFI